MAKSQDFTLIITFELITYLKWKLFSFLVVVVVVVFLSSNLNDDSFFKQSITYNNIPFYNPMKCSNYCDTLF